MASVTQVSKTIQQPRGGYLPIKLFETIKFDDGMELMPDEGLQGSIIGAAVEYLTAYMFGEELERCFEVALLGAEISEEFGVFEGTKVAKRYIAGVNGLDDDSIIHTCKLAAFDVWARNPMAGMLANRYYEIHPDEPDIENIRTLVKRSVALLDQYGGIVSHGFSFEPAGSDAKQYELWRNQLNGNFGGYTPTVDSGDGDFLTKDTIWDCKVLKSKFTSKHTLQILMYWIMGQHSGQEIFKPIKRIGFYNPRLNIAYLLNVDSISKGTIRTVETQVLCYES